MFGTQKEWKTENSASAGEVPKHDRNVGTRTYMSTNASAIM
jgi:hypothetical protein